VRSYSAVEEWLGDRCKALYKDKKIVPMKELVNETDEKTGKPAPQVYQPCMYANQWLTVMLPALGYGAADLQPADGGYSRSPSNVAGCASGAAWPSYDSMPAHSPNESLSSL